MIDTSGLSPDATHLANLLAEQIARPDAGRIAEMLEILARRNRPERLTIAGGAVV